MELKQDLSNTQLKNRFNCAYKYIEVKKYYTNCFVCGKEIKVCPSKMKRNKHCFCSLECNLIFKRGEIDEYL